MTDAIVLVNKRADGLAEVTLNRPEIHNALNEHVNRRLVEIFLDLKHDPGVRFVSLTGAGVSFCAGADLDWMRRTSSYSQDENMADAIVLANMLRGIYELPKPTIALVNGPAYGGGLGMTAVCDVAIGVKTASFTLSEVKLGLVPATISPYVVQAIGPRQARRYFLTAERFDARKAMELGLLHEVVEDQAALLAARDKVLSALRLGGPGAQAASKDLIFAVQERSIDEAVRRDTARRIAEARATSEGKEGIAAFLGKRKAAWVP
ncbi:MAG: enoyl-CoA hydratase/isomerase family protein [Alphaproteobacteria bacterium]|nr:enoyl-CoA hydratase/isomerase family protein [Alphaproteobacteria bacterium]